MFVHSKRFLQLVLPTCATWYYTLQSPSLGSGASRHDQPSGSACEGPVSQEGTSHAVQRSCISDRAQRKRPSPDDATGRVRAHAIGLRRSHHSLENLTYLRMRCYNVHPPQTWGYQTPKRIWEPQSVKSPDVILAANPQRAFKRPTHRRTKASTSSERRGAVRLSEVHRARETPASPHANSQSQL